MTELLRSLRFIPWLLAIGMLYYTLNAFYPIDTQVGF
tara:strand:+ start:21 stop:131 length:111 start_codon:yes stop_codon:yes gene_type:complete